METAHNRQGKRRSSQLRKFMGVWGQFGETYRFSALFAAGGEQNLYCRPFAEARASDQLKTSP